MELTGERDLQVGNVNIEGKTGQSLPRVVHGQPRHGLERDLVPTVTLARVDGAVHVPSRPLAGGATAARGLETRPGKKTEISQLYMCWEKLGLIQVAR